MGPGAHPKSAWEEGEQRPFNLYQGPSWPGTFPGDLATGKSFQRHRLLYCFFRFRETPQHSLREERQETVGCK